MIKLFVSGYNVISPFGLNSLPGESVQEYNRHSANQISLSVDHLLKRYTRLPYFTKLACASMQAAASMAGICQNFDKKDENTSIIVATSTTNLHPIIDLYLDIQAYGVKKINPGIFPNTVLNSISGYGAILLKCSGPNITISEGPSSSIKALEFAEDLLVNRLAERVLVCELNLQNPDVFALDTPGSLVNESVATIVLQSNSEGAYCKKEQLFSPHFYQEHISNPYTILEMIYGLKTREGLAEREDLYY